MEKINKRIKIKMELNNEQDFRDRYQVPEHFVRDPYSLTGIHYFKRMNDILENISKKNKKILDLGCGDGFFSKMLIDKGFDVTGIDYNSRAIQFSRALNPNHKFIEGDIRTYEFKQHFDAVTFIAVLEHIAPEYHNDILQSIRKVLGKEGELIILIPTKYVKVHKYHYVHFSKEEIISLLRKNGFKPIKFIYHSKMNFLLKLIYNNKVMFLLDNPFYDIKFARKILGKIYQRFFSLSDGKGEYRLLTIIAKKI